MLRNMVLLYRYEIQRVSSRLHTLFEAKNKLHEYLILWLSDIYKSFFWKIMLYICNVIKTQAKWKSSKYIFTYRTGWGKTPTKRGKMLACRHPGFVKLVCYGNVKLLKSTLSIRLTGQRSKGRPGGQEGQAKTCTYILKDSGDHTLQRKQGHTMQFFLIHILI